jgi:DNA repair protein RadC
MDDKNLTEHIKQAANTMNIRLIDHVIITDGDYYSFADNGKI